MRRLIGCIRPSCRVLALVLHPEACSLERLPAELLVLLMHAEAVTGGEHGDARAVSRCGLQLVNDLRHLRVRSGGVEYLRAADADAVR